MTQREVTLIGDLWTSGRPSGGRREVAGLFDVDGSSIEDVGTGMGTPLGTGLSDIADDILDDIWPAGRVEGEDLVVDGPPPPDGFVGWPMAVPFRSENWRQPPEGIRYMILTGDTLSGIATSYLGAPTRWREIWDLQTELKRKGRGPDTMFEGDMLVMPAEAIQVARDKGLLKDLPGEKKIPTVAYVVGGVVVLGALGTAIYYLA